MILLMILTVLQSGDMEKLPLDETIELSSTVESSQSVSDMIDNSELVFTVRSITRRLSILGWESERYDLEVGEVLKGNLEMETVYIYVFPHGMYSSRFSGILPGAEVVVSANRDESGRVMEGFNTMVDDWVPGFIYILNPAADQ